MRLTRWRRAMEPPLWPACESTRNAARRVAPFLLCARFADGLQMEPSNVRIFFLKVSGFQPAFGSGKASYINRSSWPSRGSVL